MDIVRIGTHLAKTIGKTNSTTNGTLEALPASLIEAVIPGYGVISNFIRDHLGFDISILLTSLAVVLGLYKTSIWTWYQIHHAFVKYCMSRVFIEDEDDLFNIVIRWLAAQKRTKSCRTLKACTQYRRSDDSDDEDELESPQPDVDGHFNYGKWQALMPPRFEPYYGEYRHWYKGHLFCFERHRSEKQIQVINRYSPEKEDLLEISCVGYSTEPIKRLLQDLKAWHSSQKEAMTTIRNASSKSSRWGMSWSSHQSRPSRPIETVILDDQQKEMIINDMQEFLHPESPRWYASRGIPYRRGYLFHGPPGTGKTSLSFALAGIFGLDIYCCALNDPEITEGDLRELFNCLPRRCIVLLEDIDEAGIKRPDDKPETRAPAILSPTLVIPESTVADATEKRRDSAVDDDLSLTRTSTTSSVASSATSASASVTSGRDGDDNSQTLEPQTRTPRVTKVKPPGSVDPVEPPSGPAATQPLTADGLATALIAAIASTNALAQPSRGSRRSRRPRQAAAVPQAPSAENESGISLSGLLNAIDGVATHEGRILIMTTNHPDALDEALVRTGRVDMKICFDYAGRGQIARLFERMYGGDYQTTNDEHAKSTVSTGTRPKRSWWEGLDLFKEADLPFKVGIESQDEETRREILGKAAQLFASRVPDRFFSPSDVQGFLLLHKKTPGKALQKVEDWVTKELGKRREKLQRSS